MSEDKVTRGGKRLGAGRPIKGKEKRDKNINLRVSESELLMIKNKAAGKGFSVSDLILLAVSKL